MLALCLVLALTLPAALAQDAAPEKPTWEATVEAPAPDAALSGEVEVRLRVTPSDQGDAILAAGFDGGPWTALTKGAEPGLWVGRLDTTLGPNGKRTLRWNGHAGWAKNQRIGGKVSVRVENPLRCYFGDIHSHTAYSDGVLFPEAAIAYARDVAGLDFFCLTDHLEALDDDEWRDSREQAWAANEDGRFVCFPGMEWTKKQGHANIFDPEGFLWPEDRDGFYQAVADAGLFAMFNHPGDGKGVWGDLAYSEVGDKAMRLMEVRDDAELQAYVLALNNGWHIAAAGTDDTHVANWGQGYALTGVRAPSLTKRNILDALRNRHCYSTLDANCEMLLLVNDALMGTESRQPAADVSIRIEIVDPDEGDTVAEVALYEDGKPVRTENPGTTGFALEETRTPPAGPHHYFVVARQADKDLLVSAPVWVTAKDAAE